MTRAYPAHDSAGGTKLGTLQLLASDRSCDATARRSAASLCMPGACCEGATWTPDSSMNDLEIVAPSGTTMQANPLDAEFLRVVTMGTDVVGAWPVMASKDARVARSGLQTATVRPAASVLVSTSC